MSGPNSTTVEVNPAFTDQQPAIAIGGVTLMLTPPIAGEYWWLRVRLSDTQAIVAFPKFGTIGVGFQQEDDWNTNLPYTCPAEQIYSHIRHNKGDGTIRKPRCIEVIRLIQQTIAATWSKHDESKVARMREKYAKEAR